jgi:ethanolamine utilization protein EutQ (cupin superfamily)
MAGLESKNFDQADETRTFDKGHMDLVTVGGTTIGRAVFEPGWKWSECVKPIAGTDTCQVAHTGYVISGRMHVAMDDGTEGDAGPGDMFVIAPGHDAWTVGNEPCVALDIQGAPGYAKPS